MSLFGALSFLLAPVLPCLAVPGLSDSGILLPASRAVTYKRPSSCLVVHTLLFTSRSTLPSHCTVHVETTTASWLDTTGTTVDDLYFISSENCRQVKSGSVQFNARLDSHQSGKGNIGDEMNEPSPVTLNYIAL
ncbi:hypothetical protein V1517DRAFT_311102 [Lipomyces orientalis]|uniref:Uncharacterized protein n=1 Tax=Lipomyces orientalis TaxID=1233043 RepID=A0ACC3TCV7_9ASCO